MLDLIRGPIRAARHRMRIAAVRRGVHPARVGYRYVPRETVHEHFERRGYASSEGTLEAVHPRGPAANPLPRNVASRDELPDDAGWWGYSFRDVPSRTSDETYLATLPSCRVCWYHDAAKANDFYPAILSKDGRGLDLREIRFRPRHGEVLRTGGRPQRLERATWVIERVYHNHSHWLTAHLPKLLLLRDLGRLDDVLLPPPSHRSPALEASMRIVGLEPERFRTFDMDRPLEVEELTVVGTDRFRPELLRLVPRAAGVLEAPLPRRRVFISRARATRRRLMNEGEIWPLLEPHGFERVIMEDLPFERQAELMRETRVLVAPHGAGLTNMMLCPPGAAIVEIADPGFPNPNFYAVASAMRHRYWIVPARSVGEAHPLEQDLHVDAAQVEATVGDVLAGEATGEAAGTFSEASPA